MGGLLNSLDGVLQHVIIDDQLNFDLGQKINNVLGATV